MTKITMYTKDVCPFCDRAKALLKAKGAEFTEINISNDEDVRAEMIERSGRKSVPQIFIDEHHVGGFDDMAALEAAGELDPLLGRDGHERLKESHHKLVVIGSGPAGYSAAIYGARAGLEPALISGLEVGGQLTTTTDVENWPGGADGLQGPDLVAQMREHAQRTGTVLLNDVIVSADLSQRPFRLVGNTGTYLADSVIIATGASAKFLGLPSETAFKGRGVSACATCDGFFFKDRKVVVVGGGNSALEEALYLSNIASHVTIVHRRDHFKAEQVLKDRVQALVDKGTVDVIWDHEVFEVMGDTGEVSRLRLRDTQNGDEQIIATDAMFVAIGHDPNTRLFKDDLKTESGYLVTEGGKSGQATQTSVPGVFAAGDVADPVYRQAVTSAASGAMAALDAERFLTREAQAIAA